MNDSILQIYQRLQSKFPNLNLDIQTNSSKVTYGDILIFSSSGPQHIENCKIYLAGFETGVNCMNTL